MKHELDRTVKTCEKSNIREWSKIKEQVRKTLSNVMYSETKRKPLILPIIMEVNRGEEY